MKENLCDSIEVVAKRECCHSVLRSVGVVRRQWVLPVRNILAVYYDVQYFNLIDSKETWFIFVNKMTWQWLYICNLYGLTPIDVNLMTKKETNLNLLTSTGSVLISWVDFHHDDGVLMMSLYWSYTIYLDVYTL